VIFSSGRYFDNFDHFVECELEKFITHSEWASSLPVPIWLTARPPSSGTVSSETSCNDQTEILMHIGKEFQNHYTV
jgi:hypothetical protein